jgi:hypothetical protein
MKPIDLYRKALRSGRVEMMSEVIVRLSQFDETDYLVESLMRRIELLTEHVEHPTPQERMKAIL